MFYIFYYYIIGWFKYCFTNVIFEVNILFIALSVLFLFDKTFRKKDVWYDINTVLSLPGCNFIDLSSWWKRWRPYPSRRTRRKKWIFGLVHNSHDSFVDRGLSIRVTEWSGTEWRQGGNITAVISTKRLSFGRETWKKDKEVSGRWKTRYLKRDTRY